MLRQARVASANLIELAFLELFEIQKGVVGPCRSAKQLVQLHLHSLGRREPRQRLQYR
jgi:hypothetical protein